MGAESSVSSTLSLERAIKKKKVQSDSPDSRASDEPLVTMSSTQQVVYRNGQPTAAPILIYEDTHREVVPQCIASLMSIFHLYPCGGSALSESVFKGKRVYCCLCPVAIATTCGMTLWAFSNNHLFGTAYKDILIAMDKVRL